MSSSDSEQRTGTIFMGPSRDRETSLDHLSDVAQRALWNEKTEKEYMERVRAKATESVRALLLQAKERGEELRAVAVEDAKAVLAEAERLRLEAARELDEARAIREQAEVMKSNARQEGFAAGHAEGMAQMAEARQALGETVSIVLLGIQEQCGHIFAAWRGDLSALLCEAVEKSTGWILDKDRAAVLDSLLQQSMRALLDRRHFTVRVNPVDAALLTDMLADAHRTNPHTANWELATDPSLAPGSLMVESDSALVNNSRAARASVVDEILQHLALPLSQADQEAVSAVAQTLAQEMDRHGVHGSGEEQPAAPQQAPAVPPLLPFSVPGGAEAPTPAPASTSAPASMPTSASMPTPFESTPESEPSEPLTSPEEFTAPYREPESAWETPAEPEPASFAPAREPAPEAVPAREYSDQDIANQGIPDQDGLGPAHLDSASPDAHMSAQDISDLSVPHEAEPDQNLSDFDISDAAVTELEADQEAQDMVREFLDHSFAPAEENAFAQGASAEPTDHDLPPELADELLADMGFAPDVPIRPGQGQ